MDKPEIIILGSGNVATHLGKALIKKQYPIIQVYSKTLENAKQLAEKLGCEATNQITKIKKAPLVFVCLKDDAVHPVLNKLKLENALLISTSGILPLSTYKSYSANYGVLYPLQTFSKEQKIKFKKVPLLIEANKKTNLATIERIARDLSANVFKVTSEQRKYLHLAAVFACNFSNHLYLIAEQICKEHQLDFNLLKPLIVQTAKKIKDLPPIQAQTGPAVRGDLNTIVNHLTLLKNKPELAILYRIFSERILGRSI